jgi:peptidoglycan/LPS O-acetylase OafA/YrhL
MRWLPVSLTRSGTKPTGAFRPDIQGLRTVAVLTVVANHLFGWPAGGFVGVDVFFVISGFLITGIILREHDRTGTISFRSFYRRRIRRIFPIATLVLAVTVAASYAVYLSDRAQGVATDAVWTFFFAANWRFAAADTDYFADAGLLSPLQHYWSLAVEEQFYLVWPWLLLIVLSIAAYRGRTGQRLAVAVMLLIVAGSFVAALLETESDPTGAYFSTVDRAWELGLGALLAMLAPLCARIPSPVRPVLGWIGLIGIGASLFLVKEAPGFPAPWAALPVLSTVLVIAAGTGGPQRFLFPLTNRLSVYLGDISYSLYLWHFPVIVLLAELPLKESTYYALALLVMFSLSIASFHLVEDPVRRSRWLEPRGEVGRDWRPSVFRGSLLWLLAAGTAVLAVMAIARPPSSDVDAVPVDSSVTTSAAATPQDALRGAVTAAVAADEFPEFSPDLASLGTENWVKEAAARGCADITSTNLERCASGPADAEKTVVLVGDSFGIAWMPGVREGFEKAGWRVYGITKGQCPSASVSVTHDEGKAYPECDEHRGWALAEAVRLQPDLVILADAANTLDRLASKATGAAARAEIETGVRTTVAALDPAQRRVALLSPPPSGASLQECVTRFSGPDDCEMTINEGWKQFAAAQRQAADVAKATYVDTSGWFCTESGRCPAFVGTTPVRADGGHLTVAYAKELAALIVAATSGT